LIWGARVWWRRVVSTTPPSSAATTSSPTATRTCCAWDWGIVIVIPHAIEDPEEDRYKQHEEQISAQICALFFPLTLSLHFRTTPPSGAIFLLPLLRQQKSVLNTTGAFENTIVIGRIIAFADDIRRAEFEVVWYVGCARPLHVFLIVIRALICAAHHIDFEVFASWPLTCQSIPCSQYLILRH
jgi:hypothetical protein